MSGKYKNWSVASRSILLSKPFDLLCNTNNCSSQPYGVLELVTSKRYPQLYITTQIPRNYASRHGFFNLIFDLILCLQCWVHRVINFWRYSSKFLTKLRSHSFFFCISHFTFWMCSSLVTDQLLCVCTFINLVMPRLCSFMIKEGEIPARPSFLYCAIARLFIKCKFCLALMKSSGFQVIKKPWFYICELYNCN